MADFKQVRSGKKITAETTMIDTRGKPHYVEFSATVTIKGGEIVGSQGIVRDITERKKMEGQLQMQAQLLDAASDSILLHDLDGKFFLNIDVLIT